MLPQLYQTYLQQQLSKTEYLLIACLLQLLQTLKEVKLETLATYLPMPIQFESRRRRLQRFLTLPQVNFKTLWFPIFKGWVESEFEPRERLYLVIDRTRWGKINLLIVSLVIQRRGIPIYGRLLDKVGNSNLEEQKAVLSPVFQLLEEYELVVLGDREFCSVALGNWLREEGMGFCLRLKKNEYVEEEGKISQTLNELGLVAGHHLYLQGVKVTKYRGFGDFNVAAKWRKKYRGWAPKEAWFILTNLTDFEEVIQAYRKRFGIEEMFRDFKLGGYNLEGTNLTGDRLMALIVILTLAYFWAILEGKMINKKGVQKYVGRVKEKGHSERRHSQFYIGLHGLGWVNSWGNCEKEIRELMKMNRNKIQYYRKGLRAMKLIQSVS